MKILALEKIKDYKIYLWPILAVMLTIVLVVFVIVPQTLNIITISDSISERKTQISQLNEKNNILRRIDVKLYQGYLNSTFEALPGDKDFTSAISQIQILANRSGISLLDLGISGIGKGTGSSNFQLKVTVSGGLNDLNTFIDDLKVGPRIMTIQGIEFNQDSLDNSQANFTITAFFEPTQTSLGNLEQPVQPLTQEESEFLAELAQTLKTVPVVSAQSPPIGAKGKLNPFE